MVLAVQLVLAAGVIAAAVALSHGSSAKRGPVPAARAGRFDAVAALRLAALQVRYGQRPAGSPQLRRVAERLRRVMPPGGHFEAIPGSDPTHPLRNVVATVPGRRPGIVIGAHYDTLVKPKGFLGANNGAAGSAIVVQLANTMTSIHRSPGAPELRFVLFDGEEPAAGLPEEQPDFYQVGLRGSRAYVAAHKGRTKAMLLLDYVGNKGLRLPREGTSSMALWAKVRAGARAAGVARVFPDRVGTSITDDHTPFQRAGVPAVDLIDWSYPGHRCCDGLEALSPRSIDAVGETMVAVLRTLR